VIGRPYEGPGCVAGSDTAKLALEPSSTIQHIHHGACVWSGLSLPVYEENEMVEAQINGAVVRDDCCVLTCPPPPSPPRKACPN
jgi:hypothetical protein